jgi:hypothetical protein
METKYYDIIELFLNSKTKSIIIYRDKDFKIMYDIDLQYIENELSCINIHNGLQVENDIIYYFNNTYPVKSNIEAFIERLKIDNNLHLIDEIEKLLLLGDR